MIHWGIVNDFKFETIIHKTDLTLKFAKYCLQLSKKCTTEKEHKEPINDTLIELTKVYNDKLNNLK